MAWPCANFSSVNFSWNIHRFFQNLQKHPKRLPCKIVKAKLSTFSSKPQSRSTVSIIWKECNWVRRGKSSRTRLRKSQMMWHSTLIWSCVKKNSPIRSMSMWRSTASSLAVSDWENMGTNYLSCPKLSFSTVRSICFHKSSPCSRNWEKCTKLWRETVMG